MSARTVFLICVGILGLGIGFLLGRNQGTTDEGGAVTAGQEKNVRALPTKSHSSRDNSPTEPRQKTVGQAEEEELSKQRGQFEEQLAEGRKISDYPARYEALSDVFRRWSSVDAEAAFLAWSQTPEALGMRASYPILARLRQEIEFPLLLDRVLAVSHSQLRAEGLQQLAGEVFAVEDRRGAMDLLFKNTDGEVRANAMVSGVSSWRMKEDHDVVWGWVEKHREDFDLVTMAKLERAVSGRLIASDPEEAVKWLLDRATPESRIEHLRHIVRSWSRHEPTETANWLATLPAGEGTDHAVAEYADAVMQDDPAGAAEWAIVISDKALRSQTLNMVLGVWRVTDPEAAGEFVAEKGIE